MLQKLVTLVIELKEIAFFFYDLGHVYTYATAKLQPMITSEAGKALIQTCLAKDEPVIEPIVDPPITTLNNNDVIFIDENQRKKRANTLLDSK